MSIQLQQRIKNNAKEVKEYLNGLYEWEDNMEAKTPVPKQQKSQSQSDAKLETVGESQSLEKAQQTNQQFKNLKRDVNSVGEYYNAWNKFDVDQELKTLDKQCNLPQAYNPYQNSKNNVRAKPKAQVTVKGGRTQLKDPTSLKDRGNLHYNSCEFDKAIQCYTECLNKLDTQSNRELKSVVYSNRAMARLKRNQWQEAAQDCTASLQLDPKYVKSYLRRATALKRLKRYRECQRDYLKIQEIEPQNPEAKTELQRINKLLQVLVKQAHEKLVVNANFSNILTERIDIQEVDEDQDSQARPANYLEQL